MDISGVPKIWGADGGVPIIWIWSPTSYGNYHVGLCSAT